MVLQTENNSSNKFLNKIHNNPKPITRYSNKYRKKLLDKNSLLPQNKKIKKFKQQIYFFLNLNEKDLKNKLSKIKLNLKIYIKLKKRKKFLFSLKLNPNFSVEKLKKKFLDLYLKSFILDRYSLINLIKKKKVLRKKNVLLINIRSNNIFINFLSYKKKKKKHLNFWSSSFFELHCTKRKLKFTIYTMLKAIKNKLKFIKFYIIKICCARFLHKFLYKNFRKLFLKSKFIILNSFKIFNGCRSKKLRRKKRIKFRLLR